MRGSMLTRVKICCIKNHQEVDMAVRYGASAVGLVSNMPSGPGIIDEADIPDIVARVPPGVTPFLLTCLQEVDAIIEQSRRCLANTVQLCDSITSGSYRDLRQALPGVRLVQVIHVIDENALAEARKIGSDVDALLLDSGDPGGPVKILGGTGRVHNWDISKEICANAPVPVFLAGGLHPDNIATAIHHVRPFGVDLCSGVRTNTDLDEVKLAAFMRAVRAADTCKQQSAIH